MGGFTTFDWILLAVLVWIGASVIRGGNRILEWFATLHGAIDSLAARPGSEPRPSKNVDEASSRGSAMLSTLEAIRSTLEEI